MAGILSALGDIVTSALSMTGSLVTTITNNSLLLIFTIIPMVGLGIGVFKRIVR